MKRIALMALGIMACKIAWAETYVSGTITTDTTWTLAESPYVATGTVYVANGIKLTIEPGVSVRFATETSLICYGTLNAVGMQDGTITFTSNQAIHTAGHWNGIKLSGSGANGSKISYCDIGYAKQAVYLENVSQVTITRNYIHHNKGDDGASGEVGQPGEVGCGIYLLSSENNTIENNTISQNIGGNGGGGEDFGAGGIGAGIYLSFSTNTTISGNVISQNTGGNGVGGGGYGRGNRCWNIPCRIYSKYYCSKHHFY